MKALWFKCSMRCQMQHNRTMETRIALSSLINNKQLNSFCMNGFNLIVQSWVIIDSVIVVTSIGMNDVLYAQSVIDFLHNGGSYGAYKELSSRSHVTLNILTFNLSQVNCHSFKGVFPWGSCLKQWILGYLLKPKSWRCCLSSVSSSGVLTSWVSQC